MNSVKTKRYWGTQRVARVLQVTPATVASWIDQGHLKGHRTPTGRRRVESGDLVEFLNAHGMAVPAELATLSEAAARTGGTFFPPTDAARDIPAAFKQTLEAFRHGYVLYFTPANVPSEGWHNLTVRVTKTGVYDVRARQGYFGG